MYGAHICIKESVTSMNVVTQEVSFVEFNVVGKLSGRVLIKRVGSRG